MRGKKQVSMAMVAKAAGVSPSAVSYILAGKNLHAFANETIAVVQKAAKKLGYNARRENRVHKRNPVNVPVEITLRSRQTKEILSQGTATLKDVCDEGFLLRDVSLPQDHLPMKPFQLEVFVPSAGLDDFRITGEIIRMREVGDVMELAFVRTGIHDQRYQLLKQLV